MKLGEFDGYFHLFAAFNFGYAASKEIRALVNNQLFKVSSRLKDGVENISSLLQSKVTLTEDNKIAINEDVQSFIKEASARARKFEEESTEKTNLTNFLEISFIFTGAFCIAILLLAGYEQFIHVDDDIIRYAGNNCLDLPECTAVNNAVFILNIISAAFFICTGIHGHFRNKKGDKPIPIYIPIGIVFLFLIGHIILWQFNPTYKSCVDHCSPSLNIGIAIIITWIPYFMHYLRIIWVRRIYQPKIAQLIEDIEKTFVGAEYYAKLVEKKTILDDGDKQ